MYKGTVQGGLTFSYQLQRGDWLWWYQLYFPALAAIFLTMASTSLRSLSLRLTA